MAVSALCALATLATLEKTFFLEERTTHSFYVTQHSMGLSLKGGHCGEFWSFFPNLRHNHLARAAVRQGTAAVLGDPDCVACLLVWG